MVREKEVQSQSWKKNEYYRHTSAAKKIKEASPGKNVPEVANAPKGGIGDKKLKNAVAKRSGKGSR